MRLCRVCFWLCETVLLDDGPWMAEAATSNRRGMSARRRNGFMVIV